MEQIKDYEGLYEIHLNGPNNQPGVWSVNYGYLKQQKIKKGKKKPYYIMEVPLCKNGKRKTKKVHRLVADHFINNPDNLPEVDHINRDSCDNRIKNLRWFPHNFQNLNTDSKGYSWDKRRNKWMIQCKRDGKVHSYRVDENTSEAELKRLGFELKKKIFPDYPWDTWNH